ncbi:MAG: ThuA domain-containing protein [Verrucomicrobia bacterium]|nr:ThuA domain-containing protein [Verrucomicrobiota bacterium]MDA1065251.1 ThuA domain-containing protein [Verrucomicrobiota bacterium]
MKTITRFLFSLSFVAFAVSAEAKFKVLIMDGQNNHTVWPKSTIMMKQYLEESGLFEVDIDRTRYTWKGETKEGAWLPLAGVGKTEDLGEPKADPGFNPSFARYDVVISNFGNNAADWPVETQRAFEAYVKNGGGFVSVHAADNSFGQWDEYNRMIGLGGWGGRTPESGPYVYYNHDGELVRDEDPSGKAGGHGKQHEFQITVRNSSHPITKGLPKRWLTAQDECYATLRGPAENMTVLATGKDTTENAPSDRHEPSLMVINYGKGRVFHTTLGHDTPALEGVSFITTFLRGTEWAATGKVTQAIPVDFPSTEKANKRTFTLKD